MNMLQKCVRIFQEVAGYPVKEKPIKNKDLLKIIETPKGKQTVKEYLITRLSWKEEEVKELRKAIEENDVIEIVDALVDLLYFVFGTGCTIGVDLEEVFHVIHNNNMSKFTKCENCNGKGTVGSFICSVCNGYGIKGKYRKRDGKLMKPATWTPPNIGKKLEELRNG
jgi:NTP pyrophosphatase (non-canonical NTP hydrolase)